jgi:hypothetical protein
MFLAGKLTPSSHHLSPAFHHRFTIEKPSSAPRFLQKPLQKQPTTTPKKLSAKKQRQSRSSAVISSKAEFSC